MNPEVCQLCQNQMLNVDGSNHFLTAFFERLFKKEDDDFDSYIQLLETTKDELDEEITKIKDDKPSAFDLTKLPLDFKQKMLEFYTFIKNQDYDDEIMQFFFWYYKQQTNKKKDEFNGVRNENLKMKNPETLSDDNKQKMLKIYNFVQNHKYNESIIKFYNVSFNHHPFHCIFCDF